MSNAGVTALVPMAHVQDMPASIAFYAKIGLEIVNQVTPDGADHPNWVWLRGGRAELMLALASEPVVPGQQAVLFYTYCAEIAATRAAFEAAGLSPSAIARPFYNPGGEFRLVDPDGYILYVAQI
ncbi:MAG: glyoxalase-like domain protein [Alphaproteobacteria bacterium]|nr:glyoxalase-like domain protein [Alphaproteobacteria bacterium]MDB5721667.1 glyoxalase-like domain protein [Alphaproteobacteria bacterium]